MRLVAFLGRYGHQPAPVVWAMDITEVVELAEAVGSLIEDEAEAARKEAHA